MPTERTSGTADPAEPGDDVVERSNGKLCGGQHLGREVLDPDDGWAAAEGGTTGGAAADRENATVADTWDELKIARPR